MGYSLGKTEADDLRKIETTFLRKHDYFKGFKSGVITWSNSWANTKSSVSIYVSALDDEEEYLRIVYTQTDRYTKEKKDFDYQIPLTTTPCYFGGKRYWFTCPWYKNGIYCGKRVGTLYKDGDYFACRHCYNLTYSSRKENRKGPYYFLFKIVKMESEIDKLHEQIKRPYYAGRPTRKQRKLEMLYEQTGFDYQLIAQFNKK